jgi:hypothetical protein
MKAFVTVVSDRLTLTVKDGKESLNLTVSRKGKSVSGTGSERTLSNAFDALAKFLADPKTGANYGEQFKAMKIIAENATTFDDLIKKIS